ncbi:hypothetical protein EV652_118100 [Kribbella steppae]|uniref:Uncharacterized protein n=1 Tax=Kribbella steppae TaxID=2512223 RepID=A0A4R2H046_9ACTN|nr:hypothetical protein EV652_118100 [Kribbella steppae]
MQASEAQRAVAAAMSIASSLRSRCNQWMTKQPVVGKWRRNQLVLIR